MSLFCPKCWAPAKCIDSRCSPRTNHVRRRHQCQHEECKHRFTTVEIIVGSVDLRRHDQASRSSLLDLAWEIFDQLGGDQAEQQFFDAWIARRKETQEAAASRRKAAKPPSKHKPAKQKQDHPWRLMKPLPEKPTQNA